MMDSGSPITIFEIGGKKRIMKRKFLFIGHLPDDEEYVDFKKQVVKLLGYVFCQLEVGDTQLQKSRILASERGANSFIGRDWLNASNYKFVSPNQNEGKRNNCKVTKGTTKLTKIGKPSETINSENWNEHQYDHLK